MKVAAIIPAFNEAKTIASVLSVLRSSRLFSEIIVVSDGSEDETVQRAKEAGADRVIDLPFNMGKAKALSVGVANTQAQILFFADADLLGLQTYHIRKILQPVLDGEAVMSVGLRDKGVLNVLMPILPLIGGERALRREIFEGVPMLLKDGYMIDSALNTYCYLNKLNYQRIFCPDLKIKQAIKKRGYVRSIPHYVEMLFDELKGYLLTPYYLYKDQD